MTIGYGIGLITLGWLAFVALLFTIFLLTRSPSELDGMNEAARGYVTPVLIFGGLVLVALVALVIWLCTYM